MRLHEPSAVILIRSSGAMSIIGSASISEARQAAELAARIVRKALHLNFDALQFRVRSLMARFNICSPVRLEALSRYRLAENEILGVGGLFGNYEPERFAGCVLRLVGSSRHNR
uniref:TATA box-binding protein-like protein 2 n=1 Tax=Lygus hesperus TaxID=30085 RepID=A0A0A9VRS8_LYGHE